MGFDQYHEPPEELSAETRTFARLCASLKRSRRRSAGTSSASPSSPTRRRGRSWSDAQGEEFKHFAMDLEFLLRRSPRWRQIGAGVLFQEGDIVEHGEAAEAASEGGGRRCGSERRDDGSLGIGSLKGEER